MSYLVEKHYTKLPLYQENDDNQDEGAGEALGSGGDSSSENHHMFNKFDKDENGEINWEELKNYVSSVDEYASLEDIQVWLSQE